MNCLDLHDFATRLRITNLLIIGCDDAEEIPNGIWCTFFFVVTPRALELLSDPGITFSVRSMRHVVGGHC